MKKTFALLAVATLGFAACGDDEETPDTGAGGDTDTTEASDTETTSGDDSETTDGGDTETTDGGDDTGSTEMAEGAPEEMLEQAKEQLISAGLSDEQADCVIDKAFESGMEGNTAPDFSDVQQFLEECDVSMDDLQPGG